MRRYALLAGLLLGLSAMVALGAYWQPKKYDGTPLGLYIAPGDTILAYAADVDTVVTDTTYGRRARFLRAWIDTLEGDTLRYQRGWIDTLAGDTIHFNRASFDTLTGGGTVNLQHVHIDTLSTDSLTALICRVDTLSGDTMWFTSGHLTHLYGVIAELEQLHVSDSLEVAEGGRAYISHATIDTLLPERVLASAVRDSVLAAYADTINVSVHDTANVLRGDINAAEQGVYGFLDSLWTTEPIYEYSSDWSALTNPSTTAADFFKANPTHITGSGVYGAGYVYIALGDSGMYRCTSALGVLSKVDSLAAPTWDVYHDGTRLYTVSGTSGMMRMYDVGVSLTIVDSVAVSANIKRMGGAVFGDTTFVYTGAGDSLHSVLVYGDEMTHTDSEDIEGTAAVGTVQAMWADGLFCYVAIYNAGWANYLKVVSNSGSGALTVAQNIAPGTGVSRAGIFGTDNLVALAADSRLYTYTRGGDGLLTYSDYEAPGTYVHAAYLSGGQAFCLRQGPNPFTQQYLEVFNVSSGGTLTAINEYDAGVRTSADDYTGDKMWADGVYLYVIAQNACETFEGQVELLVSGYAVEFPNPISARSADFDSLTVTDYLAGPVADLSGLRDSIEVVVADTATALRAAMSDTARAAAHDTADVLRGEWLVSIADSAAAMRAEVSDSARTAAADTATALRGEMDAYLPLADVADSVDTVRRTIEASWSIGAPGDSLIVPAGARVMAARVEADTVVADTIAAIRSANTTALQVLGNLVLRGGGIDARLYDSTSTAYSLANRSWTFKRGGTTDYSDDVMALSVSARMQDADNMIGSLTATYSAAMLDSGRVGGVSNVKPLIAVDGVADLNKGILYGSAYGARLGIDIEAAMDSLTGSVYGIYLSIDDDQGADGTVYGLYLDEASGIDYGIWQNGTAPSMLGGDLTIDVDGTRTVGDHDIEIQNAAVYSEIDAGEAQFATSSADSLKDLEAPVDASIASRLATVLADSVQVRPWRWKRASVAPDTVAMWADTTNAAIRSAVEELIEQSARDGVTMTLAQARKQIRADKKAEVRERIDKLTQRAEARAAKRHASLTASNSRRLTELLAPGQVPPGQRDPNLEQAALILVVQHLVRQNWALQSRLDATQVEVRDLTTRVEALEAEGQARAPAKSGRTMATAGLTLCTIGGIGGAVALRKRRRT